MKRKSLIILSFCLLLYSGIFAQTNQATSEMENIGENPGQNSFIEHFTEVWIPILCFIALVFSLYIGLRAILKYTKSKRFEIMLNFQDTYASEEMLSSILMLRNWKDSYIESPLHFAKEFAKLRKTDYEEVKEVDMARRRLFHFFFKIYLLEKNKVLSSKELESILTTGRIELFTQLVQPFDKSINPNYQKGVYAFFEEKLDRMKKDTETLTTT